MSEIATRRVSDVSFLERRGPGPVVVFLHGIGSNASSFAPLFSRLPDNLHLIAWNAPGYRDSAPLSDPWPVAAEYAAALARFLAATDSGPVHLLGHSLGTLIAAEFAAAHPDRLQSLVLAASASGYGVPKGGQLPDKVAARISDLARSGPAEFARARAANLVADPENNPAIVAAVEAAMAEINPEGYAQAVHMLASGTLEETLARVTIRPGFIIGAEDRITPRAQTEAAAAGWARAQGAAPRIVTIEGAGHAVYGQQPDAFAAALLDLAGLAGAGKPIPERKET